MIDPVLLRENPDMVKRSQEVRGESAALVDDAVKDLCKPLDLFLMLLILVGDFLANEVRDGVQALP